MEFFKKYHLRPRNRFNPLAFISDLAYWAYQVNSWAVLTGRKSLKSMKKKTNLTCVTCVPTRLDWQQP
jgi:hypothetical protein